MTTPPGIRSKLRNPFSILLLLAIEVSVCRASEEATPGAAGSASNMPPSMVERDPFWPVGYVPPPPDSVDSGPEEEKEPEITVPIEWPSLTVKGITRARSGRYIAVLDEIGLVEAGSTGWITRKGVTYCWKITDINKKGVFSQRLYYRLSTDEERTKP